MDEPSSQASSHFPLEPVPADILASNELKRRNEARAFGLVKSGCQEIDDYILLGGLERGSVLGVSCEEEGVGVSLGLQMLSKSLCDGTVQKAMVVTPRPVTWIAGELRDSLRRGIQVSLQEAAEEEAGGEMSAEHVGKEHVDAKERLKECLDKVMLSQVFDVDGLWEVLAELDEVVVDQQESQREGQEVERNEERLEKSEERLLEVQDSQDEESPLSPPSPPPQPQPQPQTARPSESRQAPSLILITHFSTLLTSLFTHREKTSAHSLLQLLSSRLRYLSRNLPSQPLILLLNSTSTSSSSTASSSVRPQQASRKKPLDPTLRSVFHPPDLGITGYTDVAKVIGASRAKPSFGMVFSQCLDVHLLCTRGEEGATVVEVLLDEMGVWEGRLGPRRLREQRWGAVRIQGGMVVDAFKEKRREGEIRIVAGFGGPRV